MSKSSFSLLLTSIILKSYLAISGWVVMFLPKKELMNIPNKTKQSSSINPEIMAKRVSQIKKSTTNSLVATHK